MSNNKVVTKQVLTSSTVWTRVVRPTVRVSGCGSFGPRQPKRQSERKVAKGQRTGRGRELQPAPKSTEVLVALSSESRAKIDEMVRKAVAAGGTTYSESKDYGFMYQHGFQDLDGHIWELLYMEPSAIKQD